METIIIQGDNLKDKIFSEVKNELAELDLRYAAKIAEREIALNGQIASAADDAEKAASLRDQLVFDRKKLLAELEDKKQRVRDDKEA